MNKFFNTFAFVGAVLFGSAALAEDVNYQTKFTVVNDKTEFSAVINEDTEVSEFSAKFLVAEGQLYGFNTTTKLGYSYDRVADVDTVSVETKAIKNIGIVDFYGKADIDYVTSNADFSDGDFFFTPAVGVSKSLTDNVSVYGEVEYAFNVSDDFSEVGGEVEVGLPVKVNNVYVIPSVSRTFDTVSDETTAQLEVKYTF